MTASSFLWVGRVRKVRPGDHHVVGEMPGKVALVIDCEDESGEQVLGYFAETRRPKARASAHAANSSSSTCPTRRSLPRSASSRAAWGRAASCSRTSST